MTLCVWAGAALLATLPISDFTLAWTHSIEKIRWEEDWRISPAGLEIVEAVSYTNLTLPTRDPV